MATTIKDVHLNPEFPPHNAPRVWLITSGNSAVGVSLIRHILDHGDHVVAGIVPAELGKDRVRSEEFKNFLAEMAGQNGASWKDRLKLVTLDIRMMGQCQAAVAEAIFTFGRIDILFCCTGQAVVGTVEELAASERTHALVQDQFETTFFGPINMIKAVLPRMREQKIGHIVVLSGVTGQMGTPGLGVYCAAHYALEGFCDSIIYEIAPFNVKMTILQAGLEVGVLLNHITVAPPHPAYDPDVNPAPMFRGVLEGISKRLPGVNGQAQDQTGDERFGETSLPDPSQIVRSDSEPGSETVGSYLPFSTAHKEKLLAETVHALITIGGHENPPTRHIVGSEALASIREKLKTMEDELDEFEECSMSVDTASVGHFSPSNIKAENVADFV